MVTGNKQDLRRFKMEEVNKETRLKRKNKGRREGRNGGNK